MVRVPEFEEFRILKQSRPGANGFPPPLTRARPFALQLCDMCFAPAVVGGAAAERRECVGNERFAPFHEAVFSSRRMARKIAGNTKKPDFVFFSITKRGTLR